MAHDRSEQARIDYIRDELNSLKDVVGPLNEERVAEGRLDIILDFIPDVKKLNVIENYKGETKCKSYEVTSDSGLAGAYSILSLVSKIARSRRRKSAKVHLYSLRDEVDETLRTHFGMWLEAGKITPNLKRILEKFSTFEEEPADMIKSKLYPLKGRVYIEIRNKR